MKLGLYGGAFNPIHRCHLQVAETARARLGLDTILFIPTGDPPHKPPADLFPALHRLEMVRLAIAPFPYFQLSDIETRRPDKSYSIDTVNEIKRSASPDTRLVFIVGLDAFLDIPSWRNPQDLLASCDFAVVSRPGYLFSLLGNFPFFDQNETPKLQCPRWPYSQSFRPTTSTQSAPENNGSVDLLYAQWFFPSLSRRLFHEQYLQSPISPQIVKQPQRLFPERYRSPPIYCLWYRPIEQVHRQSASTLT